MLDGILFARDGFFVHVSVLSELHITQLYIEIKKGTLEAETDEARSKDLKMQVTAKKEIISIEMSTTNLDLARDRQIRRKTWKHYNRWNEQGYRDRTCASMRHPSRCRDKTRHLTTELSASTKNRCFRDSDFRAGLNRLRS